MRHGETVKPDGTVVDALGNVVGIDQPAAAEQTQPQGRSMQELRAIIAAEDSRRFDLWDAWDELLEDDQLKVVAFARGLVAEQTEAT